MKKSMCIIRYDKKKNQCWRAMTVISENIRTQSKKKKSVRNLFHKKLINKIWLNEFDNKESNKKSFWPKTFWPKSLPMDKMRYFWPNKHNPRKLSIIMFVVYKISSCCPLKNTLVEMYASIYGFIELPSHISLFVSILLSAWQQSCPSINNGLFFHSYLLPMSGMK